MLHVESARLNLHPEIMLPLFAGWHDAQHGDTCQCCNMQTLESAFLCLQDVMMPDVSGLELLQHVRKNWELQTVPVISESSAFCS